MKNYRLLSDLAALEEQLTQLIKGASGFSVEQPAGAWSPPVDIFETAASFVLTAEVPGMSLAELDVKVVDDTLILRGARRWERDVQGENFHRLESAYGKFERTFKLSQGIDSNRITAELRRGLLKVVLPKRIGRRIEIATE
ncbi:MAG: Hsp20/alpha crystallin family protein [Chloracidobacterium sp.]|nr:Hsp20/alpha crystallin family protein [Chloracidobacterium sp.]